MTRARAYFDESGTDEKATVLCVAGYIFLEENAAAYEVEWKAMLEKYKLPYFHTQACNHGAGIFKDIPRDIRIAIQTEAIELTKKHAAKGIALSIDKEAFSKVGEGAPALWSTPYTFLCGQVLYGVRDWANETNFNGEIEYVFESGAEGEVKAVEETIGALLATEEMKLIFRYGKHTRAGKTEAVWLQSADLLSWHWFTHNRRRKEGKGKRADFKSLIEKRIDPHHYDAEGIDYWQAVWRATMRVALMEHPTHCSLVALFGALGQLI